MYKTQLSANRPWRKNAALSHLKNKGNFDRAAYYKYGGIIQ